MASVVVRARTGVACVVVGVDGGSRGVRRDDSFFRGRGRSGLVISRRRQFDGISGDQGARAVELDWRSTSSVIA